ncbi:LOW QUALITY PROTEIN: zinc finger protein PLAGL2-like [Menidia menidia]
MFNQQDHLKAHLPEGLSAGRQLFRCQDCGKQYNTQLGYRRHLVASHSAAAATGLSCPEEPPSLLETLGEHGERPPPAEGGAGAGAAVRERKYSCERCDRRFYTRKDVRRHAVVHTGRRDFLCPRCAQRFGRRDHLTRHLKKSHAQEAGLVSPCGPSPPVAAHCPVKEEPSPAGPEMAPVSKEPMEAFGRDGGASYPLASPVSGMGPPHGLMQGSLSSGMGMGHHMSPQPSPHHHHHHHHPPPPQMQPPAAALQQPYANVSRYQHGSTSYPRSDVDSFLLDLQSAPPPSAGSVGSSGSPQREVLGEGVGSPELSCTTNMDLGPLLSFLPFSLPPYNPHMGMGGLVMSYPPAAASTAATSPPPSAGLSSQAAGPFSFFQPPQPHVPQGPAGHSHSQLPQAYSPAMSTSSSLPHYYQAFQQ